MNNKNKKRNGDFIWFNLIKWLSATEKRWVRRVSSGREVAVINYLSEVTYWGGAGEESGVILGTQGYEDQIRLKK